MFEQQTFETIMERMLDKLSDEIDKREGSVAYDMLAPKAQELAQSYLELDNVLRFGFAATTYGEYLDKKVAEAGLTRLAAIKSQGTVTLTKLIDEPVLVPQGTIVYTDSNIRFLTDEDITITDENPVNINVTAENGGISYNVPANSIINIELSDVECTNEFSTTGGVDSETDEQLLDRYYKKVQASGVSGNKNHYLQWAMEIQGIGNAKIVPLWNGPGTVKVILIDVNKDPVADAKVQEVADHIADVRPIGPEVTVESAARKMIDVAATLQLQSGYTLELVIPSIEQKLRQYFKDATFIDPDIKYSRVGTIILGVDGIIDYSGLTINEGTMNIALTDTEIPTLGTVTFS